MDIMDGMSLNIEQTNKEKLQAVFPECFSEGVIDIDKLLSLCGEYITNDFEKYKFEWKGKSECLQLAQKRSTGTLRPIKDESVNFDTTQNVYIKGDNLEVLKLLQTAYYRKVKMIYIDPPYNTGNDFVYEDDFADPMSKYKEVTQQTTKSNPETMGRFHTNWLNMMYPRLMLAANLLCDDGVIFISIDDNELFNLKKVCDEVFGEENFVACIANINNPKGRSDESNFATAHEYILVYQKMGTHLIGFSPEDKILKRYNKVDEQGKYRHIDLRKTGDSDRRIDRPNMFYSFMYNENTGDLYPTFEENAPEGYIRIIPMKDDGTEGRWRVGIETAKERANLLVANYMNVKNRWTVVEKNYLSEDLRVKATTAWTFKDVNSERGTEQFVDLGFEKNVFPRPKPLGTVSRIVELATNRESNDIVLDFFSGSATTAHAVMKLNAEDGGNRKFICVQLPELTDENSEAYKAGYKTICDIGMERIRRAGQKILSENENADSLDIGFKVFELDTSNLKTWDSTLTLDDYAQEEIIERMENILSRVKADRNSLDMVYEIMLKIGKPLTDTVEAFEIDGKTAYSIGEDGNLIICLAKDVTPEYLEKLCELKPSKLVVGKDGLYSDSAMSNALYICQDRNIELKLV